MKLDFKDPKPGFYRGISSEDYHGRLHLASNSTLKIGREASMSHMKAAVEGKLEGKDTQARRFGRAVHCWLFERQKFDLDYTIPGQCTGTKKDGTACANGAKRRSAAGAWLCGVHGKGLKDEQNIISDADAVNIAEIGSRLDRSEMAAFLKKGWPELTAVAEVENTLVKVRFDWVVQGTATPVIIDLKKITVLKGSESNLLRSIRDYGYDCQAALYSLVYEILTGTKPRFLWLFVEDAPPYSLIPKFAPAQMIGVGLAKVLPPLRQWKECCDWKIWPSYGEEPVDIFPEKWEAERYSV